MARSRDLRSDVLDIARGWVSANFSGLSILFRGRSMSDLRRLLVSRANFIPQTLTAKCPSISDFPEWIRSSSHALACRV